MTSLQNSLKFVVVHGKIKPQSKCNKIASTRPVQMDFALYKVHIPEVTRMIWVSLSNEVNSNSFVNGSHCAV